MSVYLPAEDSYLLEEALKNFIKEKSKTISILDIGSGSGIQAQSCRNLGFVNILTSDINSEAVIGLRSKGLKSVKSDLFENIRKKFDLIIFNPPYLPEDKREPKDSRIQTTGGKKGFELILKFLKESKDHLNKKGVILLLFSSLSKPNIIKQNAKGLGYNYKLLIKKRFFFEELYVYKIYMKND